MHSCHLYTYTIDIQPGNRVLISQSFGLAHAMGRRLSHTRTRQVCHGRSIPERTTVNSEKRYDRPRFATHLYHLYTYTIDIQPENRVLTSQSFGLVNEVGLAFTSAVRVPVERATGLNTGAHNSEQRYDRPRVLMHFYNLYSYTIDIQPENRVLISQSFGLAHAMGRRPSHTRTRQACHGRSIPERTTLKKDMTDPMLRRIYIIYIHMAMVYSRVPGCSSPKVSALFGPRVPSTRIVSYVLYSYCIVSYRIVCIVLCCILGHLSSFQNCALLLQSVSGCCRRGLLRRAGKLVFFKTKRHRDRSFWALIKILKLCFVTTIGFWLLPQGPPAESW